MNNLRFLPLAFLFLFVSLDTEASQVLLEDVNVVTMDERDILRGKSVLVSDGYIQSISKSESVRIPEGGVDVINGSGKYLIPGLSEMHAHLPAGANGSGLSMEDIFTLFLANGVTTVRNMIGHPDHIEMREAIEKGDVLGPRVLTAGPPLDNSGFGYGTVGGVAEAREQVHSQAAKGYDHLKILEGLSGDEMEAIAEESSAANWNSQGSLDTLSL